MTPSFGDIYLVDFDPSVGHEYKKKRPALIIQEEEITKTSPCISVVPLTSKFKHMGVHDVFIPKDAKNQLIDDSIIRVQYIKSFDKKRFLHFIGRTNSPVLRQVRGYLRRHFGL